MKPGRSRARLATSHGFPASGEGFGRTWGWLELATVRWELSLGSLGARLVGATEVGKAPSGRVL